MDKQSRALDGEREFMPETHTIFLSCMTSSPDAGLHLRENEVLHTYKLIDHSTQ